MEITLETIISGMGVLGLGIVSFFLKKMIGDFERRFEKLEKEQDAQRELHNIDMNALKMNYIDRFAEVRETQYKMKDEIIDAIGKITLKIEKQNQFCYLMQEQKKVNS